MLRRDKSGIIVINKPANISSAKTVATVKRILKANKAGHTGTLDPFATGVLVCCINSATKLARFFLNGDKKYKAVLHLGVQTDTQDSSGKIVASSDRTGFSDQMIHSAIKKFEGTIEQLPPVYSALKHKGIPLYRHARRGNPIQKPPRRVHISYIHILDTSLPLVSFEVCCSAGTYIRTLCSDIGISLGCGGHLKELQRIESSEFSIDEALTLSELEKLACEGDISERMISMVDALRGMPTVVADQKLTQKIKQGKLIWNKDLNPIPPFGSKSFIKVVDADNQLIAVMTKAPEDDRLDYCCVFPNIKKEAETK
jgi:tRNA pseudouridine55 synthase